MYIAPETNIRILKNIPLDTSYEHTIFFDSSQAQLSYFMGKQKYNLSQYTYQRVGRGRARVGIKAENLYDCNYMMFQNSSFGNKWFFAYITQVEYINNITSEISFDLDVMQTWFFDHTPVYCFVEREHSETDAIGEHIEPEGVDVGEYVFTDYQPVDNFSDMSVVIAIVDLTGEDATVDGKNYDGVYGGATLYAYRIDQASEINSLLEQYIQKPDAIQTIYMVPETLLSGKTGKLPSGASSIDLTKTYAAISPGTPLNGYVPRNNKLYTYPYCFFHVDNSNGVGLSLRYEFFQGLAPQLKLYGTITQPVQIVCYPYHYKGAGVGGGSQIMNAESIQVNSFPMCSWNMDAYKAWVAQNTIPVATEAVGGLAQSVVGGIITGNAVGAVAGALSGLVGSATSAISKTYSASIQADISKGNANNGGVNSANGLNQFYCGRASLTSQYARSIDEFFTKFGYGVRRLKIPNRNSRPHWNYVKTIGATLTGSVPADDMKRLVEIYDMGVTFWKNGDEVGNYGLDNSPGGIA